MKGTIDQGKRKIESNKIIILNQLHQYRRYKVLIEHLRVHFLKLHNEKKVSMFDCL